MEGCDTGDKTTKLLVLRFSPGSFQYTDDGLLGWDVFFDDSDADSELFSASFFYGHFFLNCVYFCSFSSSTSFITVLKHPATPS